MRRMVNEIEISTFECLRCGYHCDSLDVGYNEEADELICPICFEVGCLKETNLEGCQSEKKPFKEHEYNRFCDCLMCKETKSEG
jgi:hypothetical protein